MMARPPLLVCGSAILLIMHLASIVHAVPVIIGIEAKVLTVDDSQGLLLGKIEPGDLVTGQYVFDSEAPDTDYVHGSASDTVGRYRYYSGNYGFTLASGGLIFRSDPDNLDFLIEIVNDHGAIPRDNYNVRSYENLDLYPGVTVSHIHWQLDDDSAAALDSDALLLTAPVLADWPDTWVHLTFEGGLDSGGRSSGYFVRSEVTSAYIIPEPCTMSLIALGAVILLRENRKQLCSGPVC